MNNNEHFLSQKCSGKSPDEYATQQCTKLRHDADTPDLQLSGKGFQCLFPLLSLVIIGKLQRKYIILVTI